MTLFLWGQARVVQELRTPKTDHGGCPVISLVARSECSGSETSENEIDSDLLLTYEDTWGSHIFLQEFLESRLGIKKMRHQISIKAAIQSFKARSVSYRAWKREKDLALSEDMTLEGTPISTNSPPDVQTGPLQSSFGRYSCDSAGKRPTPSTKATLRLASVPASPRIMSIETLPDMRSRETSSIWISRAFGFSPEIRHSPPLALGTTGPRLASTPTSNHREPRTFEDMISGEDDLDKAPEPPKKKKRIAPMTISVMNGGGSRAGPIPTEADGIGAASNPPSGASLMDSAPAGTPENFLTASSLGT